jgi:hypothetical protein
MAADHDAVDGVDRPLDGARPVIPGAGWTSALKSSSKLLAVEVGGRESPSASVPAQ